MEYKHKVILALCQSNPPPSLSLSIYLSIYLSISEILSSNWVNIVLKMQPTVLRF